MREGRLGLAVREVLLIAPQTPESALAEAMLRLMYGYGTHVAVARTIGKGLDRLLAGMPDLVVLSDRLPPQDDAVGVIPILRGCGYLGPIVVVGPTGGRERVRQLREAGAADALARHEIEGARFAEAILAARSPACSAD
jgi:DNA-binding response OmpR family regulator